MKCSYKTEKTCCKEIRFDLNANIVSNIEFLGGGCPGNLQALPRILDGMTVEEIQTKLGGINCGIKGTSCADQLAKAVKENYTKLKQTQ